MLALRKIELSGFKSIENASLELRPMNVLIGANGAGKSNLLSLFRLLWSLSEKRLQMHVLESGGANRLLFYGAKRTPRLEIRLEFDTDSGSPMTYTLPLVHVPEDTLGIEVERVDYATIEYAGSTEVGGTGGHDLSRGLLESASDSRAVQAIQPIREVYDFLRQCGVFQFHDTSRTAPIRQSVYVHDNARLRHDGGNLAAILRKLRHGPPVFYDRIIKTIQQVAPWFRDFVLDPLQDNPERVLLRWQDGGSEEVFSPSQLPDGALRAMALITLLLQPQADLPRLLVIDEPELGLHPYALNVVAALLQAAAHHCQVILATQSVALLEQFEPEHVIVVERENGASTFARLDPEELEDWFEDYSLGELWEKNVIGGGPV